MDETYDETKNVRIRIVQNHNWLYCLLTSLFTSIIVQNEINENENTRICNTR